MRRVDISKKKWVASVLVLIGIAVTPFGVVTAKRQRRERELRDALLTLRFVIKQYKADQQKTPESLDSLVASGYLKKVPRDPMTNTAEWQVQSSSATMEVHSTSQATGSNGVPYSSW